MVQETMTTPALTDAQLDSLDKQLRIVDSYCNPGEAGRAMDAAADALAQLREYHRNLRDSLTITNDALKALIDASGEEIGALRARLAEAEGDMISALENALESRDFYELMQDYRHVNQHLLHPHGEQATSARFESVKQYIKSIIGPPAHDAEKG